MTTDLVPQPRRAGRHARYDLPLQIVVPIGAGSEVTRQIAGRSVIEMVVANLTPAGAHRFVFVLDPALPDVHDLFGRLGILFPQAQVLIATDAAADAAADAAGAGVAGAVPLVLAAEQLLDEDAPLLVAEPDVWLDLDVDSYLAAHTASGDDGYLTVVITDTQIPGLGLQTAGAPSGPASAGAKCYVDIDDTGRPVAVVADPVSEVAAAGICTFTRAGYFLNAAHAMLAMDVRLHGEFQVAGAMAELVAAGGRFGMYALGREDAGLHRLATAADAERFITLPVAREAVIG